MTIYYSLIEKRNTNELHIFEQTKIKKFYTISEKSICKSSSDNNGQKKFNRKNDDETRELCVEYGRQVCGRCISNLYGNFDDD
jgi:hypothetical protein